MRTLVAVVDAGSFKGGAERLDMSTALASKYIGQLESRLGQRLLHRTTRSLSLTEVGAIYLGGCRQLVEDFDELEAAIQNRRQAPTGRLVVAAPVTFGELYIAPVVSEFLDRYSEVSVDLRLADRFVNLVDEGIDVAVRIAELSDSSLFARKLAEVRIVVCASPAYFEKYGKPTAPGDLADHHCIVDTNFRNADVWPFRADGNTLSIRANGRIKVNSATAARTLVMSGQGIGLIPTYEVGRDLRAGRLVEVLSKYNALNLSLHAVYPHNRHLAPKVRAFIDFLAEHFSNRLPWEC
ncbi:MAG: LysR family transcriptional regulator [Pseudomonadota bacterium]